MKKVLIFFFLLITVVISITVIADVIQKPKEYNVILISEDTLRADRLGAYGNSNVTPNIDRLAEKGVLFENAFVNYDWTLPSHVSMLASLYGSAHGVLSVDNFINPNTMTIQKFLRGKGYYTFGYTGDVFVSRDFGYDQGFDFFDDEEGQSFSDFYPKLIKHLEEVKDRRFFLFIHSYDTHVYNQPSKILNMSKPDFDLWEEEEFSILNESDVEIIKNAYDSELHEYDQYIGRLYSKLEELELLDNTILIFTSDHGEEFLEHGKIGHGLGDPYEEIIKVPMIIRFPEEVDVNVKRITAQVQSLDIAPTILHTLGYRLPKTFQGKSTYDLIAGKKDRLHEFLFTETRGGISIRTETEKYILRPDYFEYYNLSNDPLEKNSLLYPGKRFEDEYLKFLQRNDKLREKIGIAEREHDVSDEIRDRILSLGYLI